MQRMTDSMRVQLAKVAEAQAKLGDEMEKLRAICDHKDEVGSWDRYYDAEDDCRRCRYCNERM